MPSYTQTGRPLAISTPLGPDVLLLEKLTGWTAIATPFLFELDLLAEQSIDFNRILGQAVTVTMSLTNGTARVINGIIKRFVECGQVTATNERTTFIRYRAELVPSLWLLSRRVQSRIFQSISVPDLLYQILHDEWRLDVDRRLKGNYPPRNYCVQYRESDLAFVSRLIEDEGISYYFEHSAGGHRMILVDPANGFPQLPTLPVVRYDAVAGGKRDQPRIWQWEKAQEIRAGKMTLRDYHFELTQTDQTYAQAVLGLAEAGTAKHRLGQQYTVNGLDMLEIYDYPAGFTHRFDGIARGGTNQVGELAKVDVEGARVTAIRLDEETAQGLSVHGASDCAHFLPGHSFSMTDHFSGEVSALLTRVVLTADLRGAYTPAQEHGLFFENQFDALPLSLPYRPPRVTPQPRIDGVQTAVVVGWEGQEIFLDKFGRIKVQFHWDRHGRRNADSSCWVRVAQFWAGKTWGAFFWPRLGHEVLVAFEEGNPDRPIVIGSAYNDANMPPLELTDPTNLTRCGIKSQIFGGDPTNTFNALVFHDKSGEAFIQTHSHKTHMNNSSVNSAQYTHRAHISVFGSLPG
jgi:type VI secretion system secreted protein VgrG